MAPNLVCECTYVNDNHSIAFMALNLESHHLHDLNGYEIDTLYAQRQLQGQGIGRTLLNHVDELFRTNYWLTTL